ncbi:YqaJ viral recombinase family protein [Rhizobium sp. RHZ02]|uniref:lambda exonuclease family protein n=1 Tax=Rhizobium sp. RHZ02 TaxID=2769306 RepID=UPI0017800803|nr:lambda exonuclease family protein [Rhizobium sp. RHZ02]MBD9453279.1 YqaJ viral recombinase family protein [Rhizobium sp. RHZ02]
MDDIVQGSEEWLEIRKGKVTASRVADIIAKTQKGYAASRAKYAGELLVERLTGVSPERFTNAAMAWGTEMEPRARAAYEYNRVAKVDLIGFVMHPTIADSGASPDGLVGDDGLIEIKCPETHTHIKTLKGRAVPTDYATQIQWQLACTGRKWCDFVSYDPRMPEAMQFFCVRVHRVPEIIEELEKEVITFLNELRADITALRKIYDPDMQPVDGAAELLMAG